MTRCDQQFSFIKLNLDLYLAGKKFPPEVQCSPSTEELNTSIDWEQIKDTII